MNRTVFVIGAGASHGDELKLFSGYQGDHSDVPPKPPLTNQFFNRAYWGTSEPTMPNYYRALFGYIQNSWRISEPVGGPQWQQLSVEDVFSSLALLNEFAPPQTDEGAASRQLLNALTRFIRQVIGKSTLFRYGQFTKELVNCLAPDDSVLTFNYDLLLDQEFLGSKSALHYQNFCVKFLGVDLVKVDTQYDEIRRSLTEFVAPATNFGPSGPLHGLYLKLHGSLNWFTCPNPLCPQAHRFVVLDDVTQCLGATTLGFDFQCGYCQTPLRPLLIPPLAHKPIMNHPHLRNIWGNAIGVLAHATRIVIIGFSFQPSDFYAAWLFRYALQYRPDTRVIVVNPSNNDREFAMRMRGLFGDLYDGRWTRFEQIPEIIEHCRE